ncbi:MAG: hypothetical protein PHE03_10165 [Bacteroidales bacterium]|nr:hypothetical protein [Bacteroidales bacterium]MDD3892650.1 hypothetical protein [Bacteroidales bacterium]
MTFLKRATLFFILVLFTFNNYAQSKNDEPRYLINLSQVNLTGFGSIHNSLSFIDGNAAHTSGLSGAFMFNYKYYVGLYSHSTRIFNQWDDIYPSDYHPIDNPQNPLYTNSMLCFNHGGLMLGYVHNYSNLWHPAFKLKLGSGKISLVDKDFNIADFDRHHSDWVGVVSPEIGVEVNLARWCKIGLSAGYRFVFGVDNVEYVNKDGLNKRLFSSNQMSSPYVALGIYFGGFGPRTNGNQ